MQDARLKWRAPRAHANCWEDHLFYGHQRSKIVLHYQPSKPNTYPLVVVVHKYFRWRPPWMTLESSLRKCHCYVTMRVQSSWPTIRFNMQEQSTLRLKALVWFWWIDETLSANLVYQSDHEIGSTFQVVKQMKIMTWWWQFHDDDQVPGLGKEERKTKGSRQRYKW